MLKNFRVAVGGLRKTPTIFHLELEKIEFNSPGSSQYVSLLHEEDAVSVGTSINMVSINKRGSSKSSTLKQVQIINGKLTCIFNDGYDFKATLFFENNGKCQEKKFRMNVNKVSRVEGRNEFSTVVLGTVVINLHEITGTEPTALRIPVVKDDKSTNAIVELKLFQVETNGAFFSDDCSSIGSDLSFMHKETQQTRNDRSRVVGNVIPEAGQPSKWGNKTRTPEMEALLTEISILKMHLDRLNGDKESVMQTNKDLTNQVTHLKGQLRVLSSSQTSQSQSALYEEKLAVLLEENKSLKLEIIQLQQKVLELSDGVVRGVKRGSEDEDGVDNGGGGADEANKGNHDDKNRNEAWDQLATEVDSTGQTVVVEEIPLECGGGSAPMAVTASDGSYGNGNKGDHMAYQGDTLELETHLSIATSDVTEIDNQQISMVETQHVVVDINQESTATTEEVLENF